MQNFPTSKPSWRATGSQRGLGVVGQEANMGFGSRVLNQNRRPGCVDQRHPQEASRPFQI